MRLSKWLVSGVLGVFTFGAINDAAAEGGFIKGDGHNHTTPRVPVSMAALASGGTTTTISTIVSANFTIVGNNTTGDEYRIPPRDHREYVGYFVPPADKYIYIVGLIPGAGGDPTDEKT